MILSQMVKQNAEKCGDRTVFTMRFGYRTKHVTYKQLYDMARQFSLFLKDQGVKQGDPVVILAPNSPYWGVVYWGTIIHGAVLVPMNIQITAPMLERAMKQTDAKLLIKNLFYKQDIPRDAKAFDIEFLDELIKDYNPDDFVEPDIKEDDLLQIMYTSGTTGDPKGVMLTHKNISASLSSLIKVIPFKRLQKEKMLSILPLSHIYEQAIGFLLPQHYCASVVYVHSLGAIRELMKEYRVTAMVAVPEFLQVIMARIKAGVEEKGKTKAFNKMLNLARKVKSYWFSRNVLFRPLLKQFGGRLEAISSGGAPLDPELEEVWEAIGIRILQGYGMTEAAPVITANTFDDHRLASVGKPVPGVEVKLDETGQVIVKGENVFQGYYKNPEKTKEVFTKDGWFQTGDIGEFDKDGFLFLKGREKYMILGPGGQNVFPEDIEEVLRLDECVQDCAVLGLETDHGSVEIHAVLLIDPEKKGCNVEEIVDKANDQLASYQQITGMTVWPEEDFPRSATRKVQKEKVREYLKENQAEEENGGSALNKTKLEKVVAQVTGIPVTKIKPESRLVQDLKLDSLMRVELVARLEQDMGVVLSEASIVPKMTVEDLQEMINKKEPAQEPPQLASWPRSKWVKPLRAGMQRLGFLLSRGFIKMEVEGLENLKDLNYPVIFMPNHTSVIDAFVLIRALPRHIRLKLGFAAAYDVLYEYYSGFAWLGELGANAFPLPRTDSGNINYGLNNIGKMLDKGFSVGVFPEGKMSESGKLLPLKAGAGLIATQMDVPIVPVKIEGANDVVPYDKIMPKKRGTIKVTFGKPLTFKRSDSISEAQEKIYEALKTL